MTSLKRVAHSLGSPRTFYGILIAGIIVRILFVFFGGSIYYRKEDYFIQGDTSSWFYSFINLVETGTFTVNPAVENGKFFRPPGYSFLFGILYLLSFKDYLLAAKTLVFVQVLMDVFNILLVRKIALLAVKNKNETRQLIFANCSALLYAMYPFVIVWAPVLYAETPSLFFMLLCTFFSLRYFSGRNAFLGGVFGGLAALCRLQCIFALPLIGLSYLLNAGEFKRRLRAIIFFGAGIAITYGLWPARNYLFHDRILFSQDLNIGGFWSPDYMAFMDYVYAVRTDHVPVYQQIIHKEKVQWPAASYLNKNDSLLLDSVSALCFTCGTGFSYFMANAGLVPKPIDTSVNCDSAIASIFKYLKTEQQKNNAFNYWITVPMENLKKCFFKFSLYGDKSKTVKMLASSLFIFRTLMIFLGLFGIYLGLKNKFLDRRFSFFVLSYTAVWYLYLSFFYRNMEMRYLLHTDVLLLIPAAYVFVWLLTRNPKES